MRNLHLSTSTRRRVDDPHTPARGDDWRDEAACAGTDWHFPHDGDAYGQEFAKAICRGCPVRQPCFAWSIEQQEEWGVWGGVAERERRELLKRRGAPPPPPPVGIADPADARHGTIAGHKAHTRAGHAACESCHQAETRRDQDRARPPMTDDDARHGTNAGYKAHLASRTTPCAACREGHRRYNQQGRDDARRVS